MADGNLYSTAEKFSEKSCKACNFIIPIVDKKRTTVIIEDNGIPNSPVATMRKRGKEKGRK